MKRRRPPVSKGDRAHGSKDSDGDTEDDPFGFAAAEDEERRIAQRRKRIFSDSRIAGQMVNATHSGRDSAEKKLSESKTMPSQAVSDTLVRVTSSDGFMDERTSASHIDAARRGAGARANVMGDEERALRATLRQMRDAASDVAGSRRTKVRVVAAEVSAASSTPEPKTTEEFDMFAETPEHETDGHSGAGPLSGPTARDVHRGIDDSADDEGYSRLVIDEELDDGRYVAGPSLGQGVFASVYKARQVKTDRTVAVKVLRKNDVMRRAGRHEVETLQKILDADPSDRRHCVRMIDHFEHRGHAVIVFEAMAMNLRDVIKRFGGGGGIRLAAVRLYASQMFSALCLLERLGIVHADIKPDNALVSEDKTTVKLCDFGSAMDESAAETELTPYLVSRFYRAPEILLGVLPYSRALDMWSVACVLFELYTGDILFPGRNNSDMLRVIQDARGAVSGRMLKRAQFRDQYFDDKGRFMSPAPTDATSRGDAVEFVIVPERPKSDSIREAVLRAAKGDDEEDRAVQLVDLLDAMLTIDPGRRIEARDALAMPFFAR